MPVVSICASLSILLSVGSLLALCLLLPVYCLTLAQYINCIIISNLGLTLTVEVTERLSVPFR